MNQPGTGFFVLAGGEAPGEPRELLEEANRILESDPHCASAYTQRGLARLRSGDLDGAIADCGQAIQIDPSHLGAHLTLAEAHAERGDFRAVIDCCTAALGIDPRCAAAFHARAGAYLIRREFREAILDCEEALKIDPQCGGAYLTRGNARYHLGDMGGVLDYRKAFTLNAAFAAQGLVALLDAQLRANGAGALADCAEHLRRNPGDVLSYARRGLILMLMGKRAEAQKDFHQYRLRNPRGRHNLELLIEAARKRRRQ